MGYRLDVDGWLARQSKDLLLQDVDLVLARRAEAMWYVLEREAWDFFMIHIMETDRLQHFLWEEYEQGDPKYAPEFVRRYRQIDTLLGQIRDSLKPDTGLLIVSDHGFASIKYEVYVNHWLEQAGWLKFKARIGLKSIFLNGPGRRCAIFFYAPSLPIFIFAAMSILSSPRRERFVRLNGRVKLYAIRKAKLLGCWRWARILPNGVRPKSRRPNSLRR